MSYKNISKGIKKMKRRKSGLKKAERKCKRRNTAKRLSISSPDVIIHVLPNSISNKIVKTIHKPKTINEK